MPRRTVDAVGFGVNGIGRTPEPDGDLDEPVAERLHEIAAYRRGPGRVSRRALDAQIAGLAFDRAQRLRRRAVEVDATDREPEELGVPVERFHRLLRHDRSRTVAGTPTVIAGDGRVPGPTLSPPG